MRNIHKKPHGRQHRPAKKDSSKPPWAKQRKEVRKARRDAKT